MINLVSNCIYTYYSIVDLVLQYSSTKFRTGTCAEKSGAAQHGALALCSSRGPSP